MGPLLAWEQQLIAAGLVVAGLVIAAGVAGFAWGRRAGRLETQAGPEVANKN